MKNTEKIRNLSQLPRNKPKKNLDILGNLFTFSIKHDFFAAKQIFFQRGFFFEAIDEFWGLLHIVKCPLYLKYEIYTTITPSFVNNKNVLV